MEVQYHPVKAQSVGCCRRNLVDANFTVDMLDPVIDGAYVNIRYGGPVAKVYRYTCCGAETLKKNTKIQKILSLTQSLRFLSVSLLTQNRVHFLYLQERGQVVNHVTAYLFIMLVLQPLRQHLDIYR